MSSIPSIGMSLRTKVFLLVISVLSLSLLTFLAIAINLYEEDKLGYVYDVNASFTRSLATQTKNMLNGIVKTVATMDLVADQNHDALLDPDHHIQHTLEQIMRQDENVVEINLYLGKKVVFHKSNSFFLTQHQMTHDQLVAHRLANAHDLDEIRARGVLVYSELLKGDLPTMVVGYAAHQKSDVVLVARMGYGRLHEIFKETGPYSAFLVDREGKILLSPKSSEKVHWKSDTSDPLVMKVIQEGADSGAEHYRYSDGQEIIFSYAKIGDFKLAAFSTIPLAEALNATTQLLRKSVLFALTIFLGSILAAAIFTKRLTESIRNLVQATEKIGLGEFGINLNVDRNDEMGFLSQRFNKMALEIQRLLEAVKDKIRMEKELETARTVQERLFPPADANIEGFEVSAFYTPASECGGDWYGYHKINGGVILMIGDATGHGVPSALITAAAQSCATTLMQKGKEEKVSKPKASELMHYLNQAITNAAFGRVKMTFIVAIIDFNARTLNYCNAAHELPIILRCNPKEGHTDLIVLDGDPDSCLGMSSHTVYHDHTTQLTRDDILYLYTDGLLECRDANDVEWGEHHFVRNIKRHAHRHVKDIKNLIVEEAFEFSTPAGRDDDITFIVGRCA